MDFDDLDDAEELAEEQERNLATPKEAGFVPKRDITEIERLWCVSDTHCDWEANMAYFHKLDHVDFKGDAIIVAGDVSHDLRVLSTMLQICRAKFREVFFVPGNHELWLESDPDFKHTSQDDRPYHDSMQKLQYIVQLCRNMGVHTQPQVFNCGGQALWVVPVFSYHAQSFDTEPEITDYWEGVAPVHQAVKDYKETAWPDGMNPNTDDVANAIDALNDTYWCELPEEDRKSFLALRQATPEQRVKASTHVVTFSHFVPRLELNPEKRFLFYPNINKAIGSQALHRRILKLQPDVHVFGHTHFGWDTVIEGVRYIQAPLAVPRERASFSVTVIGNFPDFESHKPLLIRDGREWAPTHTAGWSEYYKQYPREAHKVKEIQERMMKMYKWKGPGEKPSSNLCFAGRKPGWELAPSWVFEKLSSKAEGFNGAQSGLMLR